MARRPSRSNRPPALPSLLKSKIYKTGQTRGADDDQIFQNRVGRNSTCLIPFQIWMSYQSSRTIDYEKDFIVLISPTDFFVTHNQNLAKLGLVLGKNALIFYELRYDWNSFNPNQYDFSPANSRTNPLGGEYVARIANTTSDDDERINVGFTNRPKGAGIRQFEYASLETIKKCRYQLEAQFWLCKDAAEALGESGMEPNEIAARKEYAIQLADQHGLLNYKILHSVRIINQNNELICPLCAEPISAFGFMSRMAQAEGRERHDLTVTKINLFHIEELTYSKLNHRPYNLGWGHHHCNVVCKDSGIKQTLEWMQEVLDRNSEL